MELKPTSVDEMRERILTYLQQGRVLIMAEAQHSGHGALPAAAVDQNMLRIDLDPADIGHNFANSDFLEVAYTADTGAAVARLAWQSIFLVAGQSAEDVAANRRGVQVRAEIPAFFQPNAQANLQRLLGALGLGPPMPPEWELDVTPQLLADDADRSAWCADKQEALKRILGAGPVPAMILFDPRSGGVELPKGANLSEPGELVVGSSAGCANIQLSQSDITWDAMTPQGVQHIRLPWHAIGAMRNAANGAGWWWPRDLPQEVRANFEQTQEIWPILQRLAGIPVPPPTPLKALQLQPPMLQDKLLAFQRLRRQGMVVLLIHALHPDVRLPPSLPGRARLLLVPLGLTNLDPDIDADDEGIAAKMPDYEGRVINFYVPWQAVFLMGGGSGGAPNLWPEDYPDFLTDALHAMVSVTRSDGGQLPETMNVFDQDASGDGLGLGLKRMPDGAMSLVVSRPLGSIPAPPGSPPGAVGRAVMELAFRLPLPTLQ